MRSNGISGSTSSCDIVNISNSFRGGLCAVAPGTPCGTNAAYDNAFSYRTGTAGDATGVTVVFFFSMLFIFLLLF